MALAIILMGVSGSGKTSVGKDLSSELNWPFFDGDDYHPKPNVDKMARGIPLDDADRQPWLETLHQLIVKHLEANQSLIIASSALKAKYRQTLRGDRDEIRFVYLKGSFNLIRSRMQNRGDHYMKPEMLRSQYQDLEEPEGAVTISVDKPVAKIVQEIIIYLAHQADHD